MASTFPTLQDSIRQASEHLALHERELVDATGEVERLKLVAAPPIQETTPVGELLRVLTLLPQESAAVQEACKAALLHLALHTETRATVVKR